MFFDDNQSGQENGGAAARLAIRLRASSFGRVSIGNQQLRLGTVREGSVGVEATSRRERARSSGTNYWVFS